MQTISLKKISAVQEFSNSTSWFPQFADFIPFGDINIFILFLFQRSAVWAKSHCGYTIKQISSSSWYDLPMKYSSLFALTATVFVTPLVLSEKVLFLPQTQTSYLILSVHKPNYQIDLKASINSSNLPHLLGADFSATKKWASKTTNHSPLPWLFELHMKQTPEASLGTGSYFLLSDELSSCVWSSLLTELLSCIKYIIHIYYYITIFVITVVFENGSIEDLSLFVSYGNDCDKIFEQSLKLSLRIQKRFYTFSSAEVVFISFLGYFGQFCTHY